VEIRKETDAELLNRLSNDPDVWSNIARHGQPVDWAPIFPQTQSGCVAYSNGEDGAQVFELSGPRAWQVVTIFGPTCRGKRALETAEAIKQEISPHADIIFGSIPDHLRAAKWFYRKLGGFPVDRVVLDADVFTANDGETLFAFHVVH